MKAYLARHKVTRKPWKGKKVIFDCTVGLRAALDASWAGLHGKGQWWDETHEIVSYELRGETVLKENEL